MGIRILFMYISLLGNRTSAHIPAETMTELYITT